MLFARCLLALTLFTPPALAVVGPARQGEDYADRVVMVLARQGGRQSICSGVVLGPRLVLTAAHCLADAANTLIAIRREGRSFPLAVDAVARHPGYNPQGSRKRRISIDVGLVQTKSALEGFRFAEIGAAPPLGAALTLAGYGMPREGVLSDGRLRAADLVAAAPLSQVTLWARDPTASGLGGCHGDSGAPLFDAAGRIAAIVAWTNGPAGHGCGAITQGPLLAPVRGWIGSTASRWGG